jgi:predicted secreted protein
LQHEGSLDRVVPLPGQVKNRDLREVSADAFAAEFMMPKWLVRDHARRHGWGTKELRNPLCVYQLSLRLAISYEATCWGLGAHEILPKAVVETLRKTKPKDIKRRVLGKVALDDPQADVWLVDEHDAGTALEAGPADIFIATLTERSGSGYLWNADSLTSAGFTLVDDTDHSIEPTAVGGASLRRLVFKGAASGTHFVSLSETRPWEKASKSDQSLELALSTFGAEAAGLPRRARPVAGSTTIH